MQDNKIIKDVGYIVGPEQIGHWLTVALSNSLS